MMEAIQRQVGATRADWTDASNPDEAMKAEIPKVVEQPPPPPPEKKEEESKASAEKKEESTASDKVVMQTSFCKPTHLCRAQGGHQRRNFQMALCFIHQISLTERHCLEVLQSGVEKTISKCHTFW